MPYYCYQCEKCNEVEELFLDMADRKEFTKCLCGGKMKRNFSLEHRKRTRGNVSVDHASESCAVHPDEAKIELEEARRRDYGSAPDYFDNDGCPHWKGDVGSVLARKRKYLKTRGMIDASSYI